jgi:hypothetical protein
VKAKKVKKNGKTNKEISKKQQQQQQKISVKEINRER